MRKVIIDELDGGHLITVTVHDKIVAKYAVGKFHAVQKKLREIFRDKVKSTKKKTAMDTVCE